MQISANTGSAIRALLTLATHDPQFVKIDAIVTDQAMPVKYDVTILCQPRCSGLVRSQRGSEGGYCLPRRPDEITLGAVLRAVDGPLAEVRGSGRLIAGATIDVDGTIPAPPTAGCLERRISTA
jgi:Rrf2 family protein